MFFAMGDDLSYGLNTLGPLCLWQCLFRLSLLCPQHIGVVVCHAIDRLENNTRCRRDLMLHLIGEHDRWRTVIRFDVVKIVRSRV